MSKQELKDKIAKMKLGLDNENVPAAQKETLKTAIANAEKMLAEIEKSEKPKKEKSTPQKGQPSFVKYDDFGRGIYKYNNKYYVDVEGVLHDMTDEGEPDTPIYNLAFTPKEKRSKIKESDIVDLLSKYENRYFIEKMESWLKDNENIIVNENKKHNLKTGDTIVFYNGYNIPMRTKIIGFNKKTGEAYLFWDSYWASIDLDKRLISIEKKPKPESTENATATFFEKALTDKTFLNKAASKFKAFLKEKDHWMADSFNEKNLFITLRVEKMLKMFCSEFGLDAEDVKELLALKFSKFFATKVAEKLEHELINLVVSNFVSKSQFAAMKSTELDSVKRDVYQTVMKMPLIGNGDKKYYLHYFNAGSDFYISELDYGHNRQDFGFAILNGDLQMAERGYISIDEMISSSNPVELDLYFDPISHKDLLEKLEESEEKPNNNYWYEVKYNEFSELVKMIPDDEVLSEYRKYEEKNYHIENIVLMAVKVGTEKQIQKAKEIYIEFLKKDAVDKDLSKKREDLYYELHEKFREKYLKVDEPTISDQKIDELVNRAIAQVFLEYGNNTEIKSIDEIVSDNQIDVHFELIREIDGMRDRSEKAEVHISFDGEVLDEFTFKIPAEFDVNKFLGTILDDLDARSRNEIYSYNIFLKDHAEELIGEKVATKTVKRLPVEKQELLKKEYTKKVKEKSATKSTEKQFTSGKLKLTKRLKAHGVTQAMIDEVNRTKEGITIRAGKQTAGKNTVADKRIKFALLPGKRLSATGKIYYEVRKNRSDKNPQKGL